jgi:hypothetical protein
MTAAIINILSKYRHQTYETSTSKNTPSKDTSFQQLEFGLCLTALPTQG